MTRDVTVVDYGVGNLFSVTRALEHCGAEVHLARTAEAISSAQRLLLPGVGAFAIGMRELESRGFVAPLRQFASHGRPFLGICLGMQLMFEGSDEFGDSSGLGLMPGRVRAIPLRGADGRTHKVPHIGWSELRAAGSGWETGLLGGVKQGAAVYFVHSYTAHPRESDRIADADYDGCRISAVVRHKNLYGCQFHPEKSGEVGLTIVRNFLAC
jgi:imidazole glycerol-phosphate synthase subunit HisH